MAKTKDGRVCARRIFQIVIVAALLLCAAGGVIASWFFVGEHGLFGYSARIVMSSSMESAEINADHEIRDVPVRSLVVLKLLPTEETAREKFYSEIREGDVLTFVYRTIEGRISVTHRVKEIKRKENGFKITLCGDNGAFAATQVIDTTDAKSGNRIIGKVVFHSYALGVLICILRDPLFLICICIIILSVLLRGALRGERSVRGAKGPPHWREI